MSTTKQTEKTVLQVEGMDCSNCALGISKKLQKIGLEDVSVQFATGEASFATNKKYSLPFIIENIEQLGYKVVDTKNKDASEKSWLKNIEIKFYISLIFTLPLFLHMFLPFSFLHNPNVQLMLCIPVMVIGFLHFGKSAWKSILSGVPNMDVLIFIGSSAAFIYSVIGSIIYYNTNDVHQFLFYETAATIITLVLLGNLLEHRSVKKTTSSIKDLSKLQQVKAQKIENGKIVEIDFEQLNQNDILLINTGDRIASDGEIIDGSALIDESMITGESLPVSKKVGNQVIGGTIIVDGSIKIRILNIGKNTTLSNIIQLVKNAQQEKPSIQKLGDKVSAVFVPLVLSISLITFLIEYFILDFSIQQAIMNSIAVLVISCPCAMGLATPTAVMVGIGRAAKAGILIKGGNTLEEFAKIKTIVFDKTGTLTTGDFSIKELTIFDSKNKQEVIDILYSLEKHSSHPIAKSIARSYSNQATDIVLNNVKENKGIGMEAIDSNGNNFQIGSDQLIKNKAQVDKSASVYVLKNEQVIATLTIEDELKETAQEAISLFNNYNIETVLLSGDTKKKCDSVKEKINLKKTYSNRHPSEKLVVIDSYVKKSPTAMVGDGINDAPALAKANVGISLGDATQIAIESSQIIILNGKNLLKINEAYQISKHTLLTIKQNLFWAFFYNVVAIPIAAAGFLNPMIGALAMAFSDVIVIGNSLRLKRKKI